MHFVNSKNERVDHATFDGYMVGDRELEDVKFVCKIVDDKIKVTGVLPHHRKYLRDLGEEKWLKLAQEYIDSEGMEPIYDREMLVDP